MRVEKTIEKKEVVTETIIEEVVCNKCGKGSGKLEDEYDYASNAFQSFSTYFGYGSRYDNETWSFDLCDGCLTDLVKTFKHSPSGFGTDGYMPFNEQLTFEYWKETGYLDVEIGMSPEEIEANGGSIYGEEDQDEV